MTFVGTGFIDPKDYPYKKWIDEQKHLDTDEDRHKIKTIAIRVEDQVGQEHLYCDKSQLDANGKFRRPKKLIEAESRGFKTVMEMDNADKKAEEDKKLQEAEDMKKKLQKSQQDLEDYKTLTEERFNKLVALIQK
jgi:predicted SAM-dependent methyltransferase